MNTRLLVKTLTGATLIPTAAVQHNGQAAFVYVLKNNKAHMQPITVGVTDGQTAQVHGNQPRRCAGDQQLRQAAGRHRGHNFQPVRHRRWQAPVEQAFAGQSKGKRERGSQWEYAP